jgi:hypothetical protein
MQKNEKQLLENLLEMSLEEDYAKRVTTICFPCSQGSNIPSELAILQVPSPHWM